MYVGFETESYYVGEAGFEFSIILLQPPKNWDYRHEPPLLVRHNDVFKPLLPIGGVYPLCSQPRSPWLQERKIWQPLNTVQQSLQPLLPRVSALRTDNGRLDGSTGERLPPRLTIYSHNNEKVKWNLKTKRRKLLGL